MQGRGLSGREARCGEVSGDHGHGLLLFDFLIWWVLGPWHSLLPLPVPDTSGKVITHIVLVSFCQ